MPLNFVDFFNMERFTRIRLNVYLWFTIQGWAPLKVKGSAISNYTWIVGMKQGYHDPVKLCASLI